jgi:hypothetical protein
LFVTAGPRTSKLYIYKCCVDKVSVSEETGPHCWNIQLNLGSVTHTHKEKERMRIRHPYETPFKLLCPVFMSPKACHACALCSHPRIHQAASCSCGCNPTQSPCSSTLKRQKRPQRKLVVCVCVFSSSSSSLFFFLFKNKKKETQVPQLLTPSTHPCTTHQTRPERTKAEQSDPRL